MTGLPDSSLGLMPSAFIWQLVCVCMCECWDKGWVDIHASELPREKTVQLFWQVSVWHHTGFLSLSPGNPKLWQRLQSLFQDWEVHSDPQQVPKDWQIVSLKKSITVRSCRHSSSLLCRHSSFLLGQQPCTCHLTSLGLSLFVKWEHWTSLVTLDPWVV